MLNSTKSFVLLNKSILYNNFKKDLSVYIDKNWITEVNYLSLFNDFSFDDSIASLHKKVKFFDYTNYNSLIEKDYNINLKKHIISKQPELTLGEFGVKLDNIDVRFLKLFSLVFGAKAIVNFHKDKVFLKNVPSVGARHGIELLYLREKILYYFNPIFKEFFKFEIPVNEFEGDNLYIIAIRPEVYMWRYDTSYCMFDIYYDIGHILGCLSLLAYLKNMNINFHYIQDNFLFNENILPILYFTIK